MKHTGYLLALLLLPLACARPGVAGANANGAPAGHGTHAGSTDTPTHGESASRDHRDRHGPPSLERYIQVLVSDQRVAELRVDETISCLALAPDAVVADIGCGPGVFALPLARACPSGVIYGADVEPGQLDALRARMKEAGLTNIVPVLASHHDPHLPPGRVDLILISDTWHHIEDRDHYLRRLAAVLAPGGRLAFVEYKPGDLPFGPPAEHKLAAGQREQELKAAGWELLESFDLHTWHDFEIWQLVSAKGAR